MQTLAERFADKWEAVTETGCWLWNASLNKTGYGQLNSGGRGRPLLAHRVSWELKHGPIPEGMCALHKCDTPACCNPDHLFLGTKAENMADMIAKGRAKHPRGRETHNARLTESDVRAIRAATDSNLAVATRFGVHPTHVCQIKKRRKWAHVA